MKKEDDLEFKTFYLYPDHDNFEKRKEMAVNYVHNFLKSNGYETDKKNYLVDYHKAVGEDCIVVKVAGYYELDGFIGNITEEDIERNNNEKLNKHLAFVNPFKNDDFKNPGKIFEESRKRVKVKVKKIKEAENQEYFNFSIEQLEKAMSEKSETIPKIETIEDLDAWLDRDKDNE